MSFSHLKLLSVLTDQTRLRILSILEKHELSVAELQDVLRIGQSRISSHLAQLKSAGLLDTRRDGQRIYYQWSSQLSPEAQPILHIALKAAREISSSKEDHKALSLVLKKRQEKSKTYFNTIAGRLGKNHCPGRSWEAVGHLLLQLTPALTIADLGAGEGLLSQLLAPRAKKIIAIDNSPRMVAVGSQLAQENGLSQLEYRLGDLENPPLPPQSVDLAILSQALHHATQPQRALQAAHKIIRKGGTILILDLNQHRFEKARELYADLWLGFSTTELHNMLQKAGFKDISVSIVAKEKKAPYFQTLLACGTK
jgi:ubiquinone/menaquinone biosynthesis C-methylase UbiE/DNA-binding transcriptional ArsR family regulator